jgi:hypothetical protein
MKPALSLASNRLYFEEDDSRIEDEDSREVGGFGRARSKRVDDYRAKHSHTIQDWSKYKPSSAFATMAAELQIQMVLAKAAIDAQVLRTLPDDWDGEGALKIEQDTVDRVLKVLRGALESADLQTVHKLANPNITPLSNGSVDIYWKSDTFTLLINVPAGDSDSAEFYGSNLGTGYDLRGRIHMDGPNLRFLDWLVE